jgi:hypothetical protein
MRTSGWKVVIGCAVLLAPNACHADHVVTLEYYGLLYTLRTERAVWSLNESVPISYSVRNLTPFPVWLHFPQCFCPLLTQVRTPADSLVWCDPCYCYQIYCEGGILPGDSLSIQTTWDIPGDTQAGSYFLRGILNVLGPAHLQLDLPIEVVASSSVREEPAGQEDPQNTLCTWGRIKALYSQRRSR